MVVEAVISEVTDGSLAIYTSGGSICLSIYLSVCLSIYLICHLSITEDTLSTCTTSELLPWSIYLKTTHQTNGVTSYLEKYAFRTT